MTQLCKSYTGLINPGDVIKHDKFMDVAVYVTSVGCLEIGATSLQITGMWMNQGFTKSWFIGEMANFSIDVKDLHTWSSAIDGKGSVCLRKCTWLHLARI